MGEEEEQLLRLQNQRQKDQQRAREAKKTLRGLKKRRKNSESQAPQNKPVSNTCPTCGSPDRTFLRCKDDFHAYASALLESGYHSGNPERILYADADNKLRRIFEEY